MNYLVIKNEKIEEASKKFGKDNVDLCFKMASEKHPQLVYWDLQEGELKDCFFTIFNK